LWIQSSSVIKACQLPSSVAQDHSQSRRWKAENFDKHYQTRSNARLKAQHKKKDKKAGTEPEFGRQIPIAKGGMELHDHLLLFFEDVAPLEIRPQVVDPPHPAALPAPQQPCSKQASKDGMIHHHQTEKGEPKNLNFARRILCSVPTFLGSDLQEPSPCSLMYLARLSRSAVASKQARR
jgi:hypothetical protein